MNLHTNLVPNYKLTTLHAYDYDSALLISEVSNSLPPFFYPTRMLPSRTTYIYAGTFCPVSIFSRYICSTINVFKTSDIFLRNVDGVVSGILNIKFFRYVLLYFFITLTLPAVYRAAKRFSFCFR